MARTEVNRSGEMEVFVQVVELGGFSAAARARRVTPSAVSKLVARLEARLGARLINRSTRSFQLTAEGCTFHERAARILADIRDAEGNVGAGERPVGLIRLNMSASYATHVLSPILPDFLDAYRDVSMDLVQSDSVVDLLAERIDVAVRAGPLRSSSLIARKLGESAAVIVGSPAYLRRHGVPETIEDLAHHNRIGFGYARAVDGWPLRVGGNTVIEPVPGRIRTSDGEGLRRLALGGSGLARLAEFTVRNDIAAGRLSPVMEGLNPGDRESFHAIHIGNGGPLPSRVRALLDFLTERGRVD